jgi:ligand-binding SRPBCC domain-containing protein
LKTFRHTFIVKVHVARVWNFYTDIKHLEIITPKEMDLKIIDSTSQNIIHGHEIWASGKIIAKIRMTWHSRITFLKPYEYIDEMFAGPFKKWRHLHKFNDIDGKEKTEIIDEIEFELPYGILGKLFEGYVYKQLQKIFENRKISTIKVLER